MNRKVLIIGLDGATFDVINPLIEEGLMPNLAKLIERGASGPMLSTIPPISGPSWLSLATGMKPEKISVYDFCNRKDNSYRLQGITSTDYAGRAIWDYLGKTGKLVGILNYPLCRPPYRVNGFMSAGLGASQDSEFTFPPDLKRELNKAAGGKYELMISYHNVRYNDTGLFLDDLQRILTKKLRAAAYLLKEKQWDFFWVVLSETDWLQHIMWRHIDEGHPLHEGENSRKFQQRFKKLWHTIDEAIGEFHIIAGEEANLVVLSDHGFGPNEEIFKLNAWLEREGYLVRRRFAGRVLHRAKKGICSLAKLVARGLKWHRLLPKLYEQGRKLKNEQFVRSVLGQIDLEKSTAFDPGHTIPFGGIYINDRLVQTPREKRGLIHEVATKLEDWGVKNNVKVEIWQGHNFDNQISHKGPDLLVGIDNWKCVMPKDQFDGELFERRPYSPRHTGSHRMNGIFIAAGPDIQDCAIATVSTCDIAPMILYLFNEPIPANMDGRVVNDIVTAEYLARHPIKLQSEVQDDKRAGAISDAKRMTDEERNTLQRQLKDLGYM